MSLPERPSEPSSERISYPTNINPSQGTPASKPLDPLDLMDEGITRQRVGVRWLFASGLLLLATVGGWWAFTTWRQPESTAVAVVTTPVERETLETRVSASGTVQLGGQTTLTAPNDVTVEAVLVEERQRVEAGEVLLVLRDRELQQRLEEERIQQQIDRLNLERKQEVVQERQRDLRQAEDRLQESQGLLQRGYISEDSYDSDRDQVDEARSQLRNAEVDLQAAQLNMQKSQTRIDNLQARLADNQIQAPFNAMVLQIGVSAGDGVPREKALLTIGDPTQERIQFELMTLDANEVRPGMPVEVSVIGPDPVKYPGQVSWISPQAVGAEASGSSSGQAKVDAIATLNQPSGSLIPGGSVNVDIITQRRPDVISVPLSAIQQSGQDPYVWVRDAAGLAQKRPVVVGLQTLEAAEIVSGLNAGDEVVVNIPPDQSLTPGTELTSETSAPLPPPEP